MGMWIYLVGGGFFSHHNNDLLNHFGVRDPFNKTTWQSIVSHVHNREKQNITNNKYIYLYSTYSTHGEKHGPKIARYEAFTYQQEISRNQTKRSSNLVWDSC